jgi:hypothetical protein
MNNTITLDQTVPISTLPRDYLSILSRSADQNKPVILLKHNKSVGAIVSDKLLRSYLKLRRMYEEERLLRICAEAEIEYASGKMLTSDDGTMEELMQRV